MAGMTTPSTLTSPVATSAGPAGPGDPAAPRDPVAPRDLLARADPPNRSARRRLRGPDLEDRSARPACGAPRKLAAMEVLQHQRAVRHVIAVDRVRRDPRRGHGVGLELHRLTAPRARSSVWTAWLAISREPTLAGPSVTGGVRRSARGKEQRKRRDGMAPQRVKDATEHARWLLARVKLATPAAIPVAIVTPWVLLRSNHASVDPRRSALLVRADVRARLPLSAVR